MIMKRNMQKDFETVAHHLFAQGERSTDNGNKCVYRGRGNLRCAIGVLIPDEYYSLEMDDNAQTSIRAIVPRFPRLVELGFDEHLEFYSDLQAVHDRAFAWRSTEEMRTSLRYVGDTYHLSTNFLDTLSFKGR